MDWLARWAFISAIVLVDGIWLWTKGVAFELHGTVGRLAIAGYFLLMCVLLALVKAKTKRWPLLFSAAPDFFSSMVQFTMYVPAGLTLSYLAASLNYPLADEFLARADAAMGFDWVGLAKWVDAHPAMSHLAHWIYSSIFWQIPAVMMLNSLTNHGDRNGEFIWNFMLGATLCVLISGLVPALGYAGGIGPAHIEMLRSIRDGSWVVMDLEKAEGIVTFPSFHTVLAILLPYCLRRIRWALGPALVLNFLMLAAIPTVGGHYLVDVIGGAVLALLSIALTRFLRGWIAALAARPRGGVLRAAASSAPLELRN